MPVAVLALAYVLRVTSVKRQKMCSPRICTGMLILPYFCWSRFPTAVSITGANWCGSHKPSRPGCRQKEAVLFHVLTALGRDGGLKHVQKHAPRNKYSSMMGSTQSRKLLELTLPRAGPSASSIVAIPKCGVQHCGTAGASRYRC